MWGGSGRSLPWKGLGFVDEILSYFFPPSLPKFSHTISDPVLYCFHARLETQLGGKLYPSKSTLHNFALSLCFRITALGKSGSSLLCIANCCAGENCCLESKLWVLKTQFISLHWCHCISKFITAVFSFLCDLSYWDHSAAHLARWQNNLALAFLWLLQAGLSPLLLLIANKNLLCFQLWT